MGNTHDGARLHRGSLIFQYPTSYDQRQNAPPESSLPTTYAQCGLAWGRARTLTNLCPGLKSATRARWSKRHLFR